jgi:hypothetical protein
MLVEITPGFYADPFDISIVRETGDGNCAAFTKGQSAVDGGFKLEYGAEQVVEEVNKARLEQEFGPEDEDGEEDDEEEDD